MTLLEILLLLFSVHSLATPILRRAPSFIFDGDAPYTVDSVTLAAALTCPNGNPTKSSPPVLLVHGTTSTGEESWGEGYVPALRANGYTACYVTLPDRAFGDMQISAEYVAYALHLTSKLASGAQTAVISHSQGGPLTQWALRFWPSTRSVTRAFVALSPDFTGIKLFDSKLSKVCVGDLCPASIWQQSAGSKFLSALHGSDYGQLVPTTAIWTQFDGVVNPPQQNAQLPGATVVSVQSLCLARPTSHITMTMDAAAYALALDALNNGGKASVSRVRSKSLGSCLRITAPHMEGSFLDDLKEYFEDNLSSWASGGSRVTKEPAVQAYAS